MEAEGQRGQPLSWVAARAPPWRTPCRCSQTAAATTAPATRRRLNLLLSSSLAHPHRCSHDARWRRQTDSLSSLYSGRHHVVVLQTTRHRRRQLQAIQSSPHRVQSAVVQQPPLHCCWMLAPPPQLSDQMIQLQPPPQQPPPPPPSARWQQVRVQQQRVPVQRQTARGAAATGGHECRWRWAPPCRRC